MRKSLLALALVASCATSGWALTVDLTTTVNSGTINGAEFIFDKAQPTGSGTLNSFLRIKNGGNEQGYNTDAANHELPFNEVGGEFTHRLRLDSLQSKNGFYRFVLDISEENRAPGSLLSLDGLKFFSTASPAQHGASTDIFGNANGIDGTLLWEMGAGNSVLLDGDRSGPGNGVSDMLLKIPTTAFAPRTGEEYLILWSRFGLLADSSASFEEWSHLTDRDTVPPPVPEPGTFLLLGGGLAGLALYRRRRQAS